MLLPRAVIEKVGYLDETLFMYCEDVDYCIRLAQAGVPAERIYVPHYIEDPFGGDLDTYRRCRDKLCEELQRFQHYLGF